MIVLGGQIFFFMFFINPMAKTNQPTNKKPPCICFITVKPDFLKNHTGQPGWLSGLAPPSAQGVILETRDRVPYWSPCVEPASPSACVFASLSLSQINKNLLKNKRKLGSPGGSVV